METRILFLHFVLVIHCSASDSRYSRYSESNEKRFIVSPAKCLNGHCASSGESCCIVDHVCCNDAINTCCEGDGCGIACESPFDATPCTTFRKRNANSLHYQYHITEEHSIKAVRAPVAGTPCEHFDTNDVLYRVIRLDEDCARGLSAKKITAVRTVNSHVLCGSRPKYTSQFISTTTSLEVAKKYFNQKRSAKIAAIQGQDIMKHCTVNDLTTPEGQNRLTKGRSRNYAIASCEVLLECRARLPCTVIKSH